MVAEEHDLPVVRQGRGRGGAVLRQDLSRQRRRRGAAGAVRLSRRQGGRRPDGRVHGVRRALHRPQRRADTSSTARRSRSRSPPTTRPRPTATGTRSSATAAQESACGWCKDKWGLSWQITPRVLTDGDGRPGRRRGQARVRGDDGDAEDRRRRDRGGGARLRHGKKKPADRSAGVVSKRGLTPFSVAVVLRLVRAFDRHAEVVGLLVGELGQLHADLLEVQAGDFFVELLRQACRRRSCRCPCSSRGRAARASGW